MPLDFEHLQSRLKKTAAIKKKAQKMPLQPTASGKRKPTELANCTYAETKGNRGAYTGHVEGWHGPNCEREDGDLPCGLGDPEVARKELGLRNHDPATCTNCQWEKDLGTDNKL